MNQYRCTHNSVCSRTDIDDRGNHAVCESSTDCEDFCSHQSERDKVLDEVNAVLLVRKMYMEELFEELRNPAVAKHSLQQIEIIRSRVNDLRDMKGGEP